MKHATLPGAFALLLLLSLSSCRQHEETPPIGVQDDSIAVSDDTENPRAPDEAYVVDLGKWYDMTYADFDRLFATFSTTNPPMILDYGICDSIKCIFPSDDADANAVILICDLDHVYTVDDAFRMLGILAGRNTTTDGNWVNIESRDERFESLKYRIVGTHADRTQQLLLQFKR